MNRLTLAFNSFEVEQQYEEVITKQTKEFQHAQKWVFLTLGIFYIALKAVEQDWIGLGLSIGSCLFIILIFTQNLITNWERIYDICLIIVILGYNLYYPIISYFQNFTNDNLYVEAYFVSLGTLGTTSVFSFRTKSILIILISVSLIGLAISSETIFWKQLVKCIIFLSLYLQNAYCQEKFRKTLFLEYQRRKTILKGIHDFTNISTYVVHYKRDKIVLVQKDDQRFIAEQDKSDFDEYLQNMRISHTKTQSKYNTIFTLDHFNKEKTISLKQLLYGVLSNDKNRTNKPNDEDFTGLNQFMGEAVFEQECYQLYLIKEFDIHPSIIIVLQEKQKEIQLQEISLKNKMFKKSLDQTAIIFDKQIKIALVYFKWIYNNQQKSQNIFLINRCLQSIYGKIVKAYNDFQNIIDFHTINQEFQNSIIKKFDIYSCLKEQTKIIRHLDVNKEIDFTLINHLEKNIVQQDEKQVKQLLYNLLFFTSNSSQSVTITLNQEFHGIHQKELIKIRIDYQGPNLTGQQLQGLQIINPQNLGELLHNSQKPFELELPLSLMIIRKIGPYSNMRLQQSRSKQNFIEFYLFRQLEESYHLIPAYSLHPLNSLILKERNNFDTKVLKNYYEKMQTSPRINISNFQHF